ncbi:MAG: metal ABC transporter substrate-binding protein [Actinomycetota bacterium]
MRAILSLVLVLALAAVGCGRGPEPGNGGDGSIDVVASFYPLAFAAERAGGDAVTVTNLTPPGVEPHDLELTPDDLQSIAEADVVVYLGGGFQPVVEDAVEAEATGVTIDAFEGIEPPPAPSAEGPGDESAEPLEEASDPHVWLDPILYSGIVTRIATALDEVDGVADADRFAANAEDFGVELSTLDDEFRRGLARCGTRVMITNHAAFGYLAAAYDLEQRAISGISPESEPDPERIAELTAQANAEGVTTIFTEDLVSPEVAETLAAEAGIDTAVLSPLEGLTDEQEAAGDDYLSVMRQNLEALRDGLVCT